MKKKIELMLKSYGITNYSIKFNQYQKVREVKTGYSDRVLRLRDESDLDRIGELLSEKKPDTREGYVYTVVIFNVEENSLRCHSFESLASAKHYATLEFLSLLHQEGLQNKIEYKDIINQKGYLSYYKCDIVRDFTENNWNYLEWTGLAKIKVVENEMSKNSLPF